MCNTKDVYKEILKLLYKTFCIKKKRKFVLFIKLASLIDLTIINFRDIYYYFVLFIKLASLIDLTIINFRDIYYYFVLFIKLASLIDLTIINFRDIYYYFVLFIKLASLIDLTIPYLGLYNAQDFAQIL